MTGLSLRTSTNGFQSGENDAVARVTRVSPFALTWTIASIAKPAGGLDHQRTTNPRAALPSTCALFAHTHGPLCGSRGAAVLAYALSSAAFAAGIAHSTASLASATGPVHASGAFDFDVAVIVLVGAASVFTTGGAVGVVMVEIDALSDGLAVVSDVGGVVVDMGVAVG